MPFSFNALNAPSAAQRGDETSQEKLNKSIEQLVQEYKTLKHHLKVENTTVASNASATSGTLEEVDLDIVLGMVVAALKNLCGKAGRDFDELDLEGES
ncbi:hypothetical protein L596_017750 [Steinernema carpocapsae]|uniref:Uncharacterized protein n=1 Tax=Steinernema carpocapsae TaxID=34508 RepID=A0A4U5N2J7_STECR|nr:hypothetical protein L596_017750 [Steinernema carpocapsae]